MLFTYFPVMNVETVSMVNQLFIQIKVKQNYPTPKI